MDIIYEKFSETELKVIKPTQEIISLSSLKKDLEDAISGRERLTKDYTEKLADIDSYISELQTKISEANKLNIKEKTIETAESIETKEI